MEFPYDERFDSPICDVAEDGPNSHSTAVPLRDPLSRAGSEQASSPQSGNPFRRESSSSTRSQRSSPVQTRESFLRQDSASSLHQQSSSMWSIDRSIREESSSYFPHQSSPLASKNPFLRLDSLSKTAIVISPPATPDVVSPQEDPTSIADYFAAEDAPQKQYSDWDIQEISRHLRAAGQQTWSEAPRLYAVLRSIDQLQFLDDILKQGIGDVFFPFNVSSVPGVLSPSSRAKFLESQSMVLTKAFNMESRKLDVHTHFGTQDVFPFEVRETLGSGSYGTVDKLFSPRTREVYARKRFKRKRGQGSKAEAQSFINELQVLKKIQHQHCVELVASYTDAKYFGLVMTPVADCNLAQYYTRIPNDTEKLAKLREFYGCLATGLHYLHTEKIRHRDIKPENILVRGNDVYLSDFGISLDWECLGGSTTAGDTPKSWIYCAPEVAKNERRNTSSDVWSLGCIFLEMWTVLKGQTVAAMRQHFKESSDTFNFFENTPRIESWSNYLAVSGLDWDNVPLKWTLKMLRVNAGSRPSAEDLAAEIAKSSHQDVTEPFVGACCAFGSDSDSSIMSTSDDDMWMDDREHEAISVLTSPGVTDKSAKLPYMQNISHLGETLVVNDLSDTKGVSIKTDSCQEKPDLTDLSVEEPTKSLMAVSGLGIRMTTAFRSFSRSNSKEIIRSQGQGSDFKDTDDGPPTPERIARVSVSRTRTPEGTVKQEHRRAAADMAAALQASDQARGVSPSRELPEVESLLPIEGPMIVVEPASGMEGEEGKALMQDLQRRRSTGSQSILPKLVPSSWSKPARLITDVINDASFMCFLKLKYKDRHGLETSATPKNLSFMIELLLKNGLNSESWTYVDKEGISPIFRVLEWGEEYKEVLKTMLKAGAKLHYETKDGRTPLIRAAARGHIWAIDVLVQAGADVNVEARRTPLVEAAMCNQLGTVTHLVTKLMATPDLKTSKGITALRAACTEGNLDVVRFLLENCRDQVDIENRFKDQTLLLAACLESDVGVARLLLDHGADVHGGKEMKAGNFSYLHFAARIGDVEMVRLLLQHNADVSARSLPLISAPLGWTPISEAEKKGKAEVTYLLLEAKTKQDLIRKEQERARKEQEVDKKELERAQKGLERARKDLGRAKKTKKAR